MGVYANLDRTEAQNTLSRGKGNKAEHWPAGIKYDANHAVWDQGLNATPINGGFANKSQQFEAVAQYQFLNGLRPSLSWINSRGKDVEGIGGVDFINYNALGAHYYFNKDMPLFAEYKINLLKDDNPLEPSTDDVMAVGMAYQFSS